MRKLLAAVMLLGVLYGGYWGAGWIGLGRSLDQAEAAARSQGTAVSYAARSISGFPSRFDINYDSPRLATAQWDWRAPLVQIFALAYRPNHVIAFAPGPHQIGSPAGAVTLDSRDARASLRARAATDLPLAEARLTIADLRLAGLFDATAEQTFAALRATDAAQEYDVFLQFDAANLPGGIRIDTLRLRAGLTLDAPLDRHGRASGPEAIRLEEMQLVAGKARIDAEGALDFDAAGLASGQITLRARKAEQLLERLLEGHPQQARARLLLAAAEKDGALELIFTISAGSVYLGPLPLGRIPPFARG